MYGYTISHEDGAIDDSCWGFYGYEYAKAEALAALACTIESERKAKDHYAHDYAL